MKKIISVTLVLSMVLSLMSFGTLMASAEDFVNYTVYNSFDEASSDGLYDGLFKAGYKYVISDPVEETDPAKTLVVGTVKGAARYGHIANAGKSVIQMPVDIAGKTAPVIVEYTVYLKGGSKVYSPQYGGAIGGTASSTYNGLDNESTLSASELKIGPNTTMKYRFIIDPAKGTITPYMGDDVKTSTVALEADQETAWLGHCYETYYATQASVTDASKLSKYIDLYYTAVYDDAQTPDFTVKSYTATDAIVQFNTPVTAATVAAMTVDGVAVTSAEDASLTEEQVETYKITFANAVGMGSHTIALADAASLTGNAINASKTIEFDAVTPLVVSGVILDTPANAFASSGAVTQMSSTTNVTPAIQDDGSILVTQTEASAPGMLRTKTIALGTQTGKIVYDFDVRSNRSTSTIYIKYGSTSTYSDSLYSAEVERGSGRINNYKVIVDYDNSTYSLYVNNTAVDVSAVSTDYISKKDSSIIVFLGNLNQATGEEAMGWASIDNFAAYKLPGATLDGAVKTGTAKDGGKVVQFTLPVSTKDSVAVINGEEYAVVKATGNGAINTYAVDTSDLDAGTYEVTLTAKSIEDTSLTKTIVYPVTLTGDKIIFSNDAISTDDEMATATFTAENNRNGDVDMMLILAEYKNGDNITFCDYAALPKTLNAYGTASFSVSNKKSADVETIFKAFIWNSLEGMHPYNTPIVQ